MIGPRVFLTLLPLALLAACGGTAADKYGKLESVKCHSFHKRRTKGHDNFAGRTAARWNVF